MTGYNAQIQYCDFAGPYAGNTKPMIYTHDEQYLDIPFPAVVRGTDGEGKRFTVDAVVCSMSTSTLQLFLPLAFEYVDKVLVVVRFSLDPPEVPALRVALEGMVQGSASLPGGTYVANITYKRHRFLYMPQAGRVQPDKSASVS